MANRLNVEPDQLLKSLKETVCKGCTDSELMAFGIVANEYGLNPFIKHIYAFPAKGGGIVPVVSVDGWITMANNHPQMDGLEFADEHDDKRNLVAITCSIYRKDRARPVVVKEYLNECRRNTDPWKMEHRMLRHKALIQCARYAFGFSGVYDEDEAADIARSGGMRETTGRVVEENPYTDQPATGQPGQQAADAPEKAAHKPRGTKQPESAQDAPTAAPEPQTPPRKQMVDDLKAAFKAAGITAPYAVTLARSAGFMKAADDRCRNEATPRLSSTSDMTDAEMVEMWQVRDTLFSGQPAKTETKTDDDDAGADYPMDGEGQEGGNE